MSKPADAILRYVDNATAPQIMTMEEALETLQEVSDLIDARIEALQADIQNKE